LNRYLNALVLHCPFVYVPSDWAGHRHIPEPLAGLLVCDTPVRTFRQRVLRLWMPSLPLLWHSIVGRTPYLLCVGGRPWHSSGLPLGGVWVHSRSLWLGCGDAPSDDGPDRGCGGSYSSGYRLSSARYGICDLLWVCRNVVAAGSDRGDGARRKNHLTDPRNGQQRSCCDRRAVAGRVSPHHWVAVHIHIPVDPLPYRILGDESSDLGPVVPCA